MNIQADSLTFVIVGDWNKFYTNPSWLAQNVFKLEQVDLELGYTPGVKFTVILGDTSCSIQPATNKFVVTSANLQAETIRRFDEVCANLVDNAKSPFIQAYGYNIKFLENGDNAFTGVIDNLPDSDALASIGASLETASISRRINYHNVTLNVTNTIDRKGVQELSINQHTECNCNSDTIKLPENSADSFLRLIQEFLQNTGFTIEQEGE